MEARKNERHGLKPNLRSMIDPSAPREEIFALAASKPEVLNLPPAFDGSLGGQQDLKLTEEDVEKLAPIHSKPVYSTFSRKQKAFIVSMAAFAAFFSPLSGNTYFPILNTLAIDLNVSNTMINLTLTSYMIFQGLAPMFFGAASDQMRRRPAYAVAFVIYLAANIGLALENSYVALLLLRCVQSAGSSGTIAIGIGVVSDIASSSEKGFYMGLVLSGTMLGPALGPVIGGLLSAYLGFRSVFWFLTIGGGVFLAVYVMLVPEISRQVVGNVYILKEKDVAIILLYNALIFVAFYDLTASLPFLFLQIYNFDDLQIGLCYLPFGAGCCVASLINDKLLDWNYNRLTLKNNLIIDRRRGEDLKDFSIEEARLGAMFPLLFLGLSSLLCYGWVLQRKSPPLAAPLVLQLIIGLCLTASINSLNTLLIDLYPQSPATATAGSNLIRCWMGAAATAIIDIMIVKMGRGWCFTFLALVLMVTSPALWVEVRWGRGWREERRVRFARLEEEKAEKRTETPL